MFAVLLFAVISFGGVDQPVEVVYVARNTGEQHDPPPNVWLERVRAFKARTRETYHAHDHDAELLRCGAFRQMPVGIPRVVPGDVTLWREISEDGRVRRVYIVASNQNPRFDHYYAQTFGGDVWKPATRSGKPVKSLQNAGLILEPPPGRTERLDRAWDAFWHRFPAEAEFFATLLLLCVPGIAITVVGESLSRRKRRRRA